VASHYIYHWNRIFGVLAVLALLLGSAVYGLSAWLAPPRHAPAAARPDASPPRAAVANTVAPPVTGPKRLAAAPRHQVTPRPENPLPAGAAPGTTEARASGPAPKAVEEPGQPLLAPAESDPPAAVAGASAQAEQPLASAEAIAEVPVPSAAVPRRSDAVVDPGPGDAASVAEALPFAPADPDPGRGNPPAEAAEHAPAAPETPAAPTPHTPFEPGEIALSSPAVQRFALAGDIENREPVSDLHTVRFDNNGIATIYAFSEVAGLAGSTLYYDWLRQGEHLAAVPIRVAADRWRSYSSKYFDETMIGTWSVQLRDADGQVLARADFTFQPPGLPGQR